MVCSPVSGNIFSDFLLPVIPVALRHAKMQSAAVPKATIYKHSKSMATKEKVRLSGQRWMPTPSLDAKRPQYGGQFKLCFSITLRTHSSHYFRAFFFAEGVRHSGILAGRENQVTNWHYSKI
jgi:hypothetical protein